MAKTRYKIAQLLRGQQLRNFIPVGRHLNLIRGRDQESTIHSVHFYELKFWHITIRFVSPSYYVDVGWLTSSLLFVIARPDHMRVESQIRKDFRQVALLRRKWKINTWFYTGTCCIINLHYLYWNNLVQSYCLTINYFEKQLPEK